MTTPETFLAALVGEWSGTSRTWFEPDKLADESPVRGRFFTVLNGAFVRHEYQGAMQGRPVGTIRQDTGARDAATWGKRAKWTDYSGPVADAGGRTFGITIYDHPQNPRHPTWWHVRDYGLFAANPFGVHDFEKRPAGTGDLKIPAGQSVTFRYRFHLHEGGGAAKEAAQKEWK